MRKTKKIGGSNVLVTVLLFLGCLTILFPLYMTIIICEHAHKLAARGVAHSKTRAK